jgi:iron complex outermembrane recepter protein
MPTPKASNMHSGKMRMPTHKKDTVMFFSQNRCFFTVGILMLMLSGGAYSEENKQTDAPINGEGEPVSPSSATPPANPVRATVPGPGAVSFPNIRASVAVADSGEATTLQKVEIVGRKQVSYRNDVSFAATKSAARLKDVPQSVSYVTKELMQDQVAFNTGDLAKNMSGINQTFNNDFTIRGFRTLGPTLLNGLNFTGGVWKRPVVWNLERFEAIKGPASALFGNADPGGTINMVTKKPLATKKQAVNFTTGSYDTYRTTLDFTGPLNPDKSLLYRLNVGYENAGSFRTLQMHKSLMVAPSITFLPDDRTSVNVDFVYSTNDGKLDRGQAIFGPAAEINLHSTPTSFAIGKTNDYQNLKDMYANASINHRFTDRLSFNATYLKYKYNEDLMEHRTSNAYGVDSAGRQLPTLMQMQTIRRYDEQVDDALATYAVADFGFGPTKHQALLGYDYSQTVVPEGSSASSSASGYRNASNTGVIAKFDPKKKSNYLLDAKGNPVPNVPHFDLENPDYSLAQIEDYIINSRTETVPSKGFSHAVYLQDQITFGPLKALLGLRREYYVNLLDYREPDEKWVEQYAWIPRVGLVWTVVPDLSLYGSYAQGFQPQSAAQMADPERFGGPFDPMTSHSFEAGAKADLFKKRVSATIAAYRITRNNILVNALDPTNVDRLTQRGQEQGQGLELDVQGQVTPALHLNLNGALNKTEITEDSDAANIGREPAHAPNVQAGLWARYNILRGSLRGIGIGAGGNHVDEQNTNDITLKLPAYQVYDAALYYNVSKFQLALKVNNLFDETHWTGGFGYNRLFPGQPRHFYTSVAYTF